MVDKAPAQSGIRRRKRCWIKEVWGLECSGTLAWHWELRAGWLCWSSALVQDTAAPVQEILPLGNAQRGRALILECLNSRWLLVTAAIIQIFLVHNILFILRRLNEGESSLSHCGMQTSMDGLALGLTAYTFKDLTSCLYYLNRYMLFPGAVATAGLLWQSLYTVSFLAWERSQHFANSKYLTLTRENKFH